MSQHHLISLSYYRYLGANATLSNVSVAMLIDGSDPKVHNDSRRSKAVPIQSEQVKHNMKKQTDKPLAPDATKPTEKKNIKNSTLKQNKAPVSKLSIIALGLTLGLAGFIYFHGHQQSVKQKAEIEQLQSEMLTLQQTLQQSIIDDIQNKISTTLDKNNTQLANLEKKIDTNIKEQIQTQQQFVAKVEDSLKISDQNIINFNERLTAISTTDNNVWLIGQADYLVNLAGRKIWNDKDYITARLLLKSADSSLAQANDPSLLPARQAINQDINALAAISYTDFDGIILTLMGLADSVTELPLVSNYQKIDLGVNQHDDTLAASTEASEEATEIGQISEDISNWYQNLGQGVESFFDKFIQIEKYDSFGECIANAGENTALLEKCQTHVAVIMPEQALYLRENIKLRLLIAAQAVPRHQELIYLRSLNDVSVWAHAYFDTESSSVKAFLNELFNLQQQSINNQNIPAQLSSKAELDKLMQTRVRTMFAN